MNHSRWPLTLTLARLHASQGYFSQASEIYSRLIADTPADKPLAIEFEAFQHKRQQAESESAGQLPELFTKWIEMLVRARFLSSQGEPD